jgi:hypothetical protein
MTILQQSDVTSVVNRLGGASVVSSADQDLINTDLWPGAEVAIKEYLGYDVEQASYTEYYPIQDGRYPEAALDARNWQDNYGAGVQHLVAQPISEIFVKQYPLRSISHVYENQEAWTTDGVNGDWTSSPEFQLTIGLDYTVDWDEPGLCLSRSLKRIGFWPLIARSVRVDYVAGFTASELTSTRWRAFKEAVKLTLTSWYLGTTSFRRDGSSGSFGMVASEGLKDWNVRYDMSTLQDMSLTRSVPPKAKELLRNHVSVSRWFAR